MIEIKTNAALRIFVDGEWTDGGNKTILCVNSDTLAGVSFARSLLGHADLQGRDLHGADFSHAHLNGTNFAGADLSGVNFSGASLWFVSLSGARLAGADFGGALLQGARLQGVDLRLADLATADLRFARYDEWTQWPENISPQDGGARLPSQVRP